MAPPSPVRRSHRLSATVSKGFLGYFNKLHPKRHLNIFSVCFGFANLQIVIFWRPFSRCCPLKMRRVAFCFLIFFFENVNNLGRGCALLTYLTEMKPRLCSLDTCEGSLATRQWSGTEGRWLGTSVHVLGTFWKLSLCTIYNYWWKFRKFCLKSLWLLRTSLPSNYVFVQLQLFTYFILAKQINWNWNYIRRLFPTSNSVHRCTQMRWSRLFTKIKCDTAMLSHNLHSIFKNIEKDVPFFVS